VSSHSRSHTPAQHLTAASQQQLQLLSFVHPSLLSHHHLNPVRSNLAACFAAHCLHLTVAQCCAAGVMTQLLLLTGPQQLLLQLPFLLPLLAVILLLPLLLLQCCRTCSRHRSSPSWKTGVLCCCVTYVRSMYCRTSQQDITAAENKPGTQSLSAHRYALQCQSQRAHTYARVYQAN
jgi:hypothetical protein